MLWKSDHENAFTLIYQFRKIYKSSFFWYLLDLEGDMLSFWRNPFLFPKAIVPATGFEPITT